MRKLNYETVKVTGSSSIQMLKGDKIIGYFDKDNKFAPKRDYKYTADDIDAIHGHYTILAWKEAGRKWALKQDIMLLQVA